MANLRDIKRRINSVKSTQKITRAMKMVAASKLRRAQEAIQQARPYAYGMRDLLHSLANCADSDAHPLMRSSNGEGVVALIVVTSDRGLCGGFNANIINKALATLRKEFKGRDVELTLVGRKGVEALRRQSELTVQDSYIGHDSGSVMRAASDVMSGIIARFLEGAVDEVHVLYNEFKSAMQQDVTLERLLPFNMETIQAGDDEEVPVKPLDYIYEPAQAVVLDSLLEKDLNIQMHRVLMESTASEHGARMSAMDAATRNAGEMIDSLTLKYNRVRQDAITTELIEVISGAEAL